MPSSPRVVPSRTNDSSDGMANDGQSTSSPTSSMAGRSEQQTSQQPSESMQPSSSQQQAEGIYDSTTPPTTSPTTSPTTTMPTPWSEPTTRVASLDSSEHPVTKAAGKMSTDSSSSHHDVKGGAKHGMGEGEKDEARANRPPSSGDAGQVADVEKGAPGSTGRPNMPRPSTSHYSRLPLKLPPEEDPLRLSFGRKLLLTLLASLVFFNGAFGSSVATGAKVQYMEQLDVSELVSTLVLTVYMIGYVVAPSFWAPLSESKGRRIVNLVSLPLFALFAMGCALARNIETVLVLRFFTGFAAAAPLSNSGACISDVWEPRQRVWPMITYTTSALMGPVVAPMVGGFLATSGPREAWRWIYGLMSIFSTLVLLLVFFFQRETYAPLLLARHARRLRQATGDESIRAPLEDEVFKWSEALKTHALRPLRMLVTEPILAYAASWMAFTYGLIFIFFEALPVVFGPRSEGRGVGGGGSVTGYGFNAGEVGLAFVPFGIGMILSFPVVHLFNKRYFRIVLKAERRVPEARLAMTALSAPCFAIGFFIFGWTARPDQIHWVVPMIGEVIIGAGLIFAFNSLAVYVTECYRLYVASALAALAMSRSVFAVVCPLFSTQFFSWSVPWASTILALIALVFSPVPLLFNEWGAKLRRRSPLAHHF